MNTLGDIISSLEDDVSALKDAQSDDPEDAEGTIEGVAVELQQRAEELGSISSALSDARSTLENILS